MKEELHIKEGALLEDKQAPENLNTVRTHDFVMKTISASRQKVYGRKRTTVVFLSTFLAAACLGLGVFLFWNRSADNMDSMGNESNMFIQESMHGNIYQVDSLDSNRLDSLNIVVKEVIR